MTDLSSLQGLAQGIDVSKSQGAVDWNAVAQAGYVFTFVKATDGQDYVDPTLPPTGPEPRRRACCAAPTTSSAPRTTPTSRPSGSGRPSEPEPTCRWWWTSRR